jgi:DNA-binding transcriptional LysR family regulator
MTPTQARAFLAVAIEGSFTGAAKRLNLSQPSVTTQVGLLERQYKVELFHRIGRGVRLTPAGNALLPTVRRLFTSLDEATTYLEDLRGQRQGYLRVGSYTPHRFIVLVASLRIRRRLQKRCSITSSMLPGPHERTPYPAFTRLRSRTTR